MPPQWHTYLQAMPTKEDFRQLIEDVEMAEEEIQENKLAVHRTQLQGAEHRRTWTTEGAATTSE